MNSCYIFVTTINKSIVVLANYSHIIPVILSLFLGLLVFLKAKFNLFSKVFLFFIVTFSIWLIGDLITWTLTNYHLIYTVWSFLDYIEIVFYVLGLYFAMVFIKKSDISIVYKILIFLSTLLPFILTITKHSVTGFNQPQCEAYNSDFLGNYKLALEGIILLIILIYAIAPFFKKSFWQDKKTDLIVLGSMFLFLSIFGITEYLASTTGYYEMNLYSLFLLPVFLVAIIYSVFELDIFNFHVLGTHYLVVGLVVLTGGQLFFITNTTNRLLTILTMVLIAGLSAVLFRNLKRESDQRVQIAKLNIDLENLLKQRESLTHLITHKVKGSFTHSKYIFAEMLEGTFGAISPELQKMAEKGMESDNIGINTVDLILNAANLQKGLIKYDLKKIDFKDIVLKTFSEKKVPAETQGLQIEKDIKNGDYYTCGDSFWLKETIDNLVENSIKYTKAGKITMGLEKRPVSTPGGNEKILFFVKDTGLGITEEDKKNLFTEGGRGKDSVKTNVDSTGYGLYTVKMVIEAHKGRVWAESEGAGKGSAFFVELPLYAEINSNEITK